jgi:hypothetical protein
VVLAIAVLAAITLALWFLPYSTRSYQGDGTITDTGFWSYPRYHVRFPAVSLAEPGEHTFTCRGLPPVPLTATLQLVGQGQYELLGGLKTRVHLKVSDDAGATVCEAMGPLNAWKLMWIPYDNTGAYWHPTCTDVVLRSGRTYRLTLTVTDIDGRSSPLLVEPMLEGGGNELP